MFISPNKCLIGLLLTLSAILWGCAKINSPTGGPRDRRPPVVVESVPQNGAKNFKGKKIIITFDEFITLEQINEKFMVSPPLAEKPEIFLRGKNLNITFKEELRDSTTYSLNFQDAIRDLNEGNIYNNYQFVFSTGSVIDSLSVMGRVFTAFSLEIPENTSILLYRNLADSAVKTLLPDYISRTDQTGSFRVNNMRPGNYRIYALKDIDNSKNYNQVEEEFAFQDSVITVTPENNYLPVKDTASLIVEKDPSAVKAPRGAPSDKTQKPALPVPEPVEGGEILILFAAEGTEYYLTGSGRKLAYHMIYTLSLPPDTMDFNISIPDAAQDSYFVERNENKDTLNVWLTDSSLFSQQQITSIVNFPFTDTTGIVVNKEDTIQMRFMTPRKPRGAVAKTPLQVTYNMRGGVLKPGQQMILTSQTPLRQPDTSLIKFYETADKNQILVPYELNRDPNTSLRYIVNAKLQAGKKYLFIADSAAFSNIYGEYTDSTGIRFSVPEANAFGELTLNIKEVNSPLIIQLLTKEEKVLTEKYVNADGKVVFPLLDKGFYRLRAIFDMNNDRKWTTGDFSKGRQPEPVSFYRDEIEVKTDWKVENDWVPGIKKLKDEKLRSLKKR